MDQLYFEKYANFRRENEPVTVSIPFARGEVPPEKLQTLKIFCPDETATLQTRPLSHWDDGTVKWCKVDFLANLPANEDKTYRYGFDDEINDSIESAMKLNESSPGYYALRAMGLENVSCSIASAMTDKNPFRYSSNDEHTLTINNGSINVTLNNAPGLPPFNALMLGDFYLSQDQINGPYVVDADGTKHTATLTTPWEVEEQGNVMMKLSAQGKHTVDISVGANCVRPPTFLDFILTITIHVNTPWFELNYRIINKEAPEFVYIKKIGFDFHMPQDDCKQYALATSNYRSHIRTQADGSDLHQLIDSDYLLSDANEHTPEAFYGTFFADWNGKNGGICATHYQAYQNCPKALRVNSGMLSVEILPDGHDLKYYRGMAKNHRIFIHLHPEAEPVENLNKRSLMLQHPDKPLLSPEVYKDAGVYPNIFAFEKYAPFENFLLSTADNRGKAYGILHWGDCPDMGYSQQGRGGGEYVWTNNEYDFPLAAMQMFARSGIRRMLDYALVSAAHWMDIDVCHHDPNPLKHGSQIEHSKEHVTGNIEISHMWVEGLFAYYHQTGCKFAYDTAIGIGQNIMRHLDEPRYHQAGEINARETGWALRSLLAIYQETNDPVWLKHVEFIVSHFKTWRETYGGWFAPYTCHTVMRVPFMIAIAACSLMRYYRIFPSVEIRDMIINAVDDLVENTILENGLFYYKEIPSLRRPGANPIILEALASAYELTDDEKYLDAGWPTFLLNLQRQTSSGGKKEKIDGGLLIPGTGPKGFAQSFFPMAYYYAMVAKSGTQLPLDEPW